ncbi:uncharacterized protein DSM5745_03866 [Aspergillus mulundensis]|uniref:GP-PDE domain-containing protein n=1 Tax=Aspergillus mulundensis TaxID=1810919 RepID=A0A3D8SB66_9EURO|nr:hypothetical protein DSM5745_03866 [Aspergillus mulundensis]RDW83540.1 hypothetical protein DSM5745_03866 [Aspergillus mulundensis]
MELTHEDLFPDGGEDLTEPQQPRRPSAEEALSTVLEIDRRTQRPHHGHGESSAAAAPRVPRRETFEDLLPPVRTGDCGFVGQPTDRHPDGTLSRMRFPQAIAHRGLKSDTVPENTLAAFRAAVEAGAHAIQTDVHLSADGVPVLTHDKSLKRCFGVRRKVASLDWIDLQNLRTVGAAQEPMPRLTDLLHFLNQPENRFVWVLLDLKMCNDPNLMVPAIAGDISLVAPVEGTAWKDRIVLAVWKAGWIPPCVWSMGDFKVALSAWSPSYAIGVLDELLLWRKTVLLDCSLLNHAFESERGQRFREKFREQYPNQKIFSWSDDSDLSMARSIRNGLDGVICDDPARYLGICRQWEDDEAFRDRISEPTRRQKLQWLYCNVVVYIYEFLLLMLQGSPWRRAKRGLKGDQASRRTSLTMPNET